MPRNLPNLLNLIKAVADSTRLRIAALLAAGELTVGEITQILKQSQPRVSRHLKLLCAAGVLERFKEDHFVYYRMSASESALRLHEGLDPTDPTLSADRERREIVIADRARRATDRLGERAAPSAAQEAMAGTVGEQLVADLAAEPLGQLLDIGTGAGFLLKTLAPRAQRAVGIDISTDALRLARSQMHGAGLGSCVLRRGDMYRLAFGANEFDTVTLGRVLSHAEQPAAVLAEVQRVLRPGGRLVLIDDFDALESAGAANPITQLRRWLLAAGFSCEQLRPIDTGNTHLLLTIARRPHLIKEAA